MEEPVEGTLEGLTVSEPPVLVLGFKVGKTMGLKVGVRVDTTAGEGSLVGAIDGATAVY